MDNPYFNILGHATGRLLLQREGYAPDLETLIAHAKACGCFFEINSSPNRLDLSDEHARMAKNAGVKIAVNTDAHSIGGERAEQAGQPLLHQPNKFSQILQYPRLAVLHWLSSVATGPAQCCLLRGTMTIP